MQEQINTILFSLLRSAMTGKEMTAEERALYEEEVLSPLFALAQKHDVAHLVAVGLEKNGWLDKGNPLTQRFFQEQMKAVYRYEQLNYAYSEVCAALENAKIPFLPLKGAVIRAYYPEPWMRTSCDIDILIHSQDLQSAIKYLKTNNGYVQKGRSTHDVSLYSAQGQHIELHFDLLEEDWANNANSLLNDVWKNVTVKRGYQYCYEMSDAFFYFYHIAHMAKHFEVGGCGIKPFIDLWVLDEKKQANFQKREELLKNGKLFVFAQASQKVSQCWFQKRELDDVAIKMQKYILTGGVYGSSVNRVAIQQTRKGGKIGYVFSRIFIPYAKLKRYYPILEKHPWLTPIMQVRRWFMLLNPKVAKMAKNELAANKKTDKSKAADMSILLEEIGL